MTGRCARCDWQASPAHPDPARHADDAGHPLCAVCARSLRLDEEQSCMPCVGRARADLIAIADACALAQAALAGLPPAAPGPRARGAEAALPGGDALVMLGPGSDGAHWRGQPNRSALDGTPWRVPRRLRRQPPADPDPGDPMDLGVWVEDDANDNWPADPPSAAAELGRWEDDWRSLRGEPAADQPPAVATAGRYLMARIGWAARAHPAFAEFAADLRELRARLEAATATDDRPLRAAACCFDCGGPLQRSARPRRDCPHARAEAAAAGWDRRDPAPVRCGCDRGGLVDDWVCAVCGQVYDQERYWLAVRANLEAGREHADPDRVHAGAGGRWVHPGRPRRADNPPA